MILLISYWLFYLKHCSLRRDKALPCNSPTSMVRVVFWCVCTLGPGFPVGPLAPRAPRGPWKSEENVLSQKQTIYSIYNFTRV